MKRKTVEPLEAQEQRALFEWARLQSGKYPELALMYHIPNGGRRNAKEAAMLKAEGVKPGVPDICLPVSRSIYHGLYIELKRKRGGKTSDAQKEWINGLKAQGYAALVCRGWEDAKDSIIEYLKWGMDRGTGN